MRKEKERRGEKKRRKKGETFLLILVGLFWRRGRESLKEELEKKEERK